MIRVLIADDHPLVREAIKVRLSVEDDLAVVGEASDGKGAVESGKALAPDLVVLDLHMPGLAGSELVSAMRAAAPASRILVLTGSLERHTVRDVLAAGGDGYVLKEDETEELVSALRRVALGERHVSARIAAAFEPAGGQGEPELTPREIEILREIARGRGSQQIAAVLGISIGTARKHRENMMKKLGLHNAAEVTAYAIKKGYG
jgi:DNA-binding NarL/FixJ family response regulator